MNRHIDEVLNTENFKKFKEGIILGALFLLYLLETV